MAYIVTAQSDAPVGQDAQDAKLWIYDLSRPDAPRKAAELPLGIGTPFELRPAGHTLLLLQEGKFEGVTSIDVSRPEMPRIVQQYELTNPQLLVVSADARIVAIRRRTGDGLLLDLGSSGVLSLRKEVADLDPPSAIFGENGSYFLDGEGWDEIWSLSDIASSIPHKQTLSVGIGWTFLLSANELLTTRTRALTSAIWRFASGRLQKVATLPFAFHDVADAWDGSIVEPSFADGLVVHDFGNASPGQSAVRLVFDFPIWTAKLLPGKRHLLVDTGTEMGIVELGSFEPGRPALQMAYEKISAGKMYGDEIVARLEAAGVQQLMADDLGFALPERLAILQTYAQALWDMRVAPQRTPRWRDRLAVLMTMVRLAPDHADLYEKLGDAARQAIAEADRFDEKEQLARMALDAYRDYEKRGGRLSAPAAEFRRLNVLEFASVDVCRYVDAFSSARRLNEITSPHLEGVEVGGKTYEVAFVPDQTGTSYAVRSFPPGLNLFVSEDEYWDDTRLVDFKGETYLLLDRARLVKPNLGDACQVTDPDPN